MRELRDYVWLLDRDIVPGHLLHIAVDEAGNLLPPVIIFSDAKWDKPEFENILAEEKRRLPPEAHAMFRFNAKDHHYSWRTLLRLHRDASPGIQWTAVIPLDYKDYRRQTVATKKKEVLFEPLERLLRLPELLNEVQMESKKWCICRQQWNRRSPNMVLCANLKCQVGWYHMTRKCANLDKGADLYRWLCPKCREDLSSDLGWTDDEDPQYGSLQEESSFRVQWTRALTTVWHSHSWPSNDEISRVFAEIARNLDIVRSATLPITPMMYLTARVLPSSWVLRKDDPKTLILASSRRKQLVFYDTDIDHTCIEDGESDTDGGSDNEDVSAITNRLESVRFSESFRNIKR
ncbi:hypothetical protein MMC21_005872 [Puttea exsequens]|nr:hypothetical protein [Puttea exsequens]